MATTAGTSLEQLLGDEAESLLTHRCTTIPAERLTVPGPTWVDDVMTVSDRPVPVLRSLQSIFDHGRLGGTGYVSILPVDQGIEHSGARLVRAESGLSSTRRRSSSWRSRAGATRSPARSARSGLASRRYAHRIPFILKINHNEFLTYPNAYDQIMFAPVKQAWDMGARRSARRSTSARTSRTARSTRSRRRSPRRTSWAWRRCSGATCATPPSARRTAVDYHVAADLTARPTTSA